MTELKTHGTLDPNKGTCDLCGYPIAACSDIQIGKAHIRALETAIRAMGSQAQVRADAQSSQECHRSPRQFGT